MVEENYEKEEQEKEDEIDDLIKEFEFYRVEDLDHSGKGELEIYGMYLDDLDRSLIPLFRTKNFLEVANLILDDVRKKVILQSDEKNAQQINRAIYVARGCRRGNVRSS